MAIHRELNEEELKTNLAVFRHWRNSGQHLPHFLRDFHDQKDLFKFIFHIAKQDYENDPAPRHIAQNMSWADGHVFAVDYFLWLMAEFGYTLQKSKKQIAFNDVEETVKTFTKEQKEQMAKVLMSGLNKEALESGEENETTLS